MSKHTAGPWRYEVCDAEINARVYGKRREFVAEVWSGKARIMEVVKANAHLIAVAPDLLNTAEQLLSLIDRYVSIGQIKFHKASAVGKQVKAARRAILKATHP